MPRKDACLQSWIVGPTGEVERLSNCIQGQAYVDVIQQLGPEIESLPMAGRRDVRSDPDEGLFEQIERLCRLTGGHPVGAEGPELLEDPFCAFGRGEVVLDR